MGYSYLETCSASNSDVWLARDGQFDSPGFSAKYGTYTVMDVNSGKIVDFVVLQKLPVDGELEKPACEILLEGLTQKLKVTLFVSDRYRGIRKLMRTKYLSITDEFDVWHFSKSLTKKWKGIGKHLYLIQAWSKSSKTCDNNEEMLLEKFMSILYHITDVHKWDGNKFVNACEHHDLSYMLRPRNWLQPNSHDNWLGKLESFHSVALKYKSKRNHFSYDGMVARSKLKYSKPLKKSVGVNVYDNKTHKLCKEILERVILVVKGKLRLELDNDPTVLQVYQNALHQFPDLTH
ncbi:hypothetical protein PR048_019626 [Dryococelus australis]|uniref:Transposase n=1 Tax=Dryococelus australis TaxID=614101 RepID=A0ABQ9H406_9NEOP|nr:hypothetical protein PR048_019626 [Dryococelus australis]